MRFEEVELAVEDEFAETARRIAIAHPSEGPPYISIPLHVDGFESHYGREVHLPLGNDEPISVEVEFPGVNDDWKARYTMIGKFCTGEIGPTEYMTERQVQQHNRAFDDWTGAWGGFLKAVVTVKEVEGRTYDLGEAELALMESQEEFDEYGQTDGRTVFENRDRLAA